MHESETFTDNGNPVPKLQQYPDNLRLTGMVQLRMQRTNEIFLLF